ncbi:MAG: helix-turn-helix transcriptional regulator [Eubacteriaceae bacterium]|nr:helix-turn-helix transcriptional regulator [Eubacteriaceae bacterium]
MKNKKDKNKEEKNSIIRRILELCKINGISVYRLAINSNIPKTTLNNMIRDNKMPTFPTIEKICMGFDITLAQFFMSEEIFESLTQDQKEILELWESLDGQKKLIAKTYMTWLAKGQKE